MTILCFLIIFSFRLTVCKEQTLGKYKQCLFSYSYIRRDIIFPTFPVSPWFCGNIFQRSVSLSPLIFTSLLTDVHPRRHNILTLFIYRMPCNFCCTERNIHALVCRHLAYRKMLAMQLTFLATSLFMVNAQEVF